MYKGLEHTAIASPDPLRLAQWYVNHLGFHINFEYAGNYFVEAANGALIEIIPSEGESLPAAIRTPGIRHIAIAVDNFDQAREQLASQGTTFAGEPYTNEGNRLQFFQDPDGNLLHLIQRAKPLPSARTAARRE